MKSIKKYLLLVSLLLCTAAVQFAGHAGGGCMLYRIDSNNELEFFFCLDPWQRNHDRMGFEHSGGAIGDEAQDGAIILGQPKTFLRGAVRETLEELVGVPAIQMTKNDANPVTTDQLYKPIKRSSGRPTLQINQSFQKTTIDKITDYFANVNGISCLYKPKIFGKNSKPHHQNAIFFWNVTGFCNHNLPQDIVQKRIEMKQKNPQLNLAYDLHAEPSAFAWIKAKHLWPHLQSNKAAWVPVTSFAQHDEKTNSMITIDQSKLQAGASCNGGTPTDVVRYNSETNQHEIRISPACMGMMQDRVDDEHNPQADQACIKKGNKFIVLDNNKLRIQSNTPEQTTSSMRSIIRTFTKIAKLKNENPHAAAFL